MINLTPYTNFHEMNLDWILAKVKELDEKFGSEIEAEIIAYVDAHLSQYVLSVQYNAANERLTVLNVVN